MQVRLHRPQSVRLKVRTNPNLLQLQRVFLLDLSCPKRIFKSPRLYAGAVTDTDDAMQKAIAESLRSEEERQARAVQGPHDEELVCGCLFFPLYGPVRE